MIAWLRGWLERRRLLGRSRRTFLRPVPGTHWVAGVSEDGKQLKMIHLPTLKAVEIPLAGALMAFQRIGLMEGEEQRDGKAGS